MQRLTVALQLKLLDKQRLSTDKTWRSDEHTDENDKRGWNQEGKEEHKPTTCQ